jgi:hypothetical protein
MLGGGRAVIAGAGGAPGDAAAASWTAARAKLIAVASIKTPEAKKKT